MLLRMDRARFLDPRPYAEAQADPIAESVNVPLEELAARMSELPPKAEPVRVADVGSVAIETVRFLRDGGREAVLVEDFARGSSGGRLWEPNSFLAQCAGEIPLGTALDLGCGAGRDAVFLSSGGWRVTAIDRLPDCTVRGAALEARYGGGSSNIKWVAADVLDPSFEVAESFDLVLMLFFFDRALHDRAKRLVRPGGSLLVEAFTTIRQAQNGRPSSNERVVRPGELRGLVEGWEVVRFEEAEQVYGHTSRLWARKPV